MKTTPLKPVIPKVHFSRVKEARDAIKARAMEVIEIYMNIIAEAREAGNHEVAFRAAQWLIEHMPNDDGYTIIDSSAAKPKEIAQTGSGPTIQIGIALTPPNRKTLAPAEVEVIDPTGIVVKNE